MNKKNIQQINIKDLHKATIHIGFGTYTGYLTLQKLTQNDVIDILHIYGVSKFSNKKENNTYYKISLDTASSQCVFIIGRPLLASNQTEAIIEDVETEDNFLHTLPAINIKPNLLDNISKERLVEILQDYIANDYEVAETNYVKDILKNVCGVNEEEAKAIGIEYIFKN